MIVSPVKSQMFHHQRLAKNCTSRKMKTGAEMVQKKSIFVSTHSPLAEYAIKPLLKPTGLGCYSLSWVGTIQMAFGSAAG
jgi:hypothetical protein